MFHPEREEVAHYFRFQEIAVGRRYAARRHAAVRARPASRSRSTGTPSTTCARTRAASDYPEGSEQRVRAWRSSTTPTRACSTCWTRCSTAARSLLAVATGTDVRAQGAGGRADAAAVGRRRDDRRAELRVRAAGAAAPRAQATSSGSSSCRTAPTSSTATSRSCASGRSCPPRTNDAIAWQKTEVIETEETYALCRCGQSSHEAVLRRHARCAAGSTARRPPTRARRPSASRVVGGKRDRRAPRRLALHARRVLRRSCWSGSRRCWTATSDSDVRARVIALIDRCPSGSYTLLAHRGRRGHRGRPPRRDRRDRGGGRARRRALGHGRHPGHALGRSAVRDAEPRHPLPLRPVREQAALRRHASGDRLPRGGLRGVWRDCAPLIKPYFRDDSTSEVTPSMDFRDSAGWRPAEVHVHFRDDELIDPGQSSPRILAEPAFGRIPAARDHR